MSKVHWIKTGQRGARAEFTDSDLITALLLIDREPIGRYNLQKKLLLSDSSTKSMLNYCKKINLLESIGKKGHQLTHIGQEFVDLINNIILKHGLCSFEFFQKLNHYYVIIAKKDNLINNQTLTSWKCRDIAVAYGAESIILLIYENGSLNFPEKDMDLEKFYPDLEIYFQNEFTFSNNSSYYLLFAAAKRTAIAQKSAIITALHLQSNIIDDLRDYYI